jgi:hypothetical protein
MPAITSDANQAISNEVEQLIEPLPLEAQLGVLVALLTRAIRDTPPQHRQAVVAVIVLTLGKCLVEEPEELGSLH